MKPDAYKVWAQPTHIYVKVHRYQRDGKLYEVSEIAYYVIAYPPKKLEWQVTVPVGFRTDFASIPRMFQHIISPVGKWSSAALFHDYIYSKQFEGNISRKQADDMFYVLARHYHTNAVTAWVMWACVRMFGKWSWKK